MIQIARSTLDLSNGLGRFREGYDYHIPLVHILFLETPGYLREQRQRETWTIMTRLR